MRKSEETRNRLKIHVFAARLYLRKPPAELTALEIKK